MQRRFLHMSQIYMTHSPHHGPSWSDHPARRIVIYCKWWLFFLTFPGRRTVTVVMRKLVEGNLASGWLQKARKNELSCSNYFVLISSVYYGGQRLISTVARATGPVILISVLCRTETGTEEIKFPFLNFLLNFLLNLRIDWYPPLRTDLFLTRQWLLHPSNDPNPHQISPHDLCFSAP